MTTKVSLNITISWTWITIIGAGFLIILYAQADEDHRPLYIFIATVLGASCALLSALSTVIQRQEMIKQSKIQVAFDFINRWNNPQFYHARKEGRAALTTIRQLPTTEAQRSWLDDGEKWSNLIDILNFFESLGIAIRRESADTETAKQFFRHIITGYWQVFEKVIKERRAERSNPRLFIELEWLFNEWSNH